jgi:hypothetical protein
MTEQDSNIDHLFRDNLTNYAVDPPPEVWKGVQGKIQPESRIFRSKLANYEVTPPQDVWYAIQARIQVQVRKIPVFYRVAAASVTLFILAASSWLLFFNEPEVDNMAESIPVLNAESEQVLPEATVEQVTLPEEEAVAETPPEKNEPVILLPDPQPENPPSKNLIAMVDEVEDDSRGDLRNEEVQTETNAIQPMALRSDTDPVFYRYLALKTDPPNDLMQPLETPSPVEKSITLKDDFVKWSVGGHVSPIYSFRYIGQNSLNSFRDDYNKHENGLVTYSGGINIKYNSSRKLSVYTGVYYAKIGQQIDNIQIYRSAGNESLNLPIKGNLDINNSLGTIGSENDALFFRDDAVNRVDPSLEDIYDPVKAGLIPMDANIIQSLEYLEIPLILRYKVIDRRFDFNILGGISTNIMVGNSSYANLDGKKINIGETTGLKTLNYSSTIGIGLEYSITENVSFNLEPAFKFYINSINLDETLNTHPYTIGIFTGLNYNFK